MLALNILYSYPMREQHHLRIGLHQTVDFHTKVVYFVEHVCLQPVWANSHGETLSFALDTSYVRFVKMRIGPSASAAASSAAASSAAASSAAASSAAACVHLFPFDLEEKVHTPV